MPKDMPASRRANRTVLFRTILLMAIFGVAMFIPLVLKLYNIQILRHDQYEQMAVEQQTRDTVISPRRGAIFDTNMNVLAVNASVETVFLAPAALKGDEARAAFIAQGLADILDVDYKTIYERALKKNRQYEVVKKKIEKELADAVRTFISDNELERVVYVTPDYKRYYPGGNFLSQVLGFVGDDNQGLDGVEAVYNKKLEGTPGRVIAARDASGQTMPFQYEKIYEGEEGLSAVLTIDSTMQHFLENQLKTALIENDVRNRAAGIIMDVKTGEILAMDTQYGYDPNNPRALSDPEAERSLENLVGEERSEALKEQLFAQWRNKIVNDTYEPGSTFKIVTTAVALEEKVVGPDDAFFCSGSVMIPGWGRPVHCHKLAGHGSENFVQGVQNSCNPVFIAVSQRVGQQKFYDYFSAFGFTKKTGVDLPGESASVFHSQKNFLDDVVALPIYSFGQTFNITPIQLITAVSAVANGGNLMKPHILKAFVDSEQNIVQAVEAEVVRKVISQETSKQTCEILETVVSIGTGRNAFVPGYRIAGKTGTSQKRDPVTRQYMSGKYIVSFVGFAPADDPQIACLVLLDEPMYGPANLRSGGGMAAPVVGRIMADVLPYIGVEPQYTEEQAASMAEITAPELVGLSLEEAQAILEEKGIKNQVKGKGDTVTAQVPAAGAQAPGTATIVLYTGDTKPPENVTVPDVTGLTPEQANRALVNAGLYMRAKGAAARGGNSVVASSQSVQAAQKVAPGTTVEVSFLDTSIRD